MESSPRRAMPGSLAGLAMTVALLLAVPGLALAQAGWYVTPSLDVTEEYDDNVFRVSQGRQSDFITRFTPGVKLGYKSEPLTVLGKASMGSEVFADNSQLSGVANRKNVGLEVSAVAERPQSFGLSVSYAESQRPVELQPVTGIELGVHKTTLYGASPWVSHPFTASLSGQANYSFSRSEFAGGFTNTTHQSGLTLTDVVTPLDTARARYEARVFDSQGLAPIVSHVFTVGWTRLLAATSSVSLDLGGRLTEGSFGPEAKIKINHAFEHLGTSLSYAHTQTEVIGQQGVANTDSVSASAAAEPFRLLQMSVGTRFSRTTAASHSSLPDTTTWGADVGVSYTLARWVTARASYRFWVQDGNKTIYGNVFSIGLDLGDTYRLY